MQPEIDRECGQAAGKVVNDKPQEHTAAGNASSAEKIVHEIFSAKVIDMLARESALPKGADLAIFARHIARIIHGGLAGVA